MELVLENIKLRNIQESDLRDLCIIYGSTRIDELDRGTNWTEEQKKMFIEQQFFAQHRYYQDNYKDANFYILEKENSIIGRLYIDYSFEQKIIHIIDITLLPDWQKQSIGTSILNKIIKQAEDKNFNINIHVETFNPAMALYKRLGFVKISETNGVYHLLEWSSK